MTGEPVAAARPLSPRSIVASTLLGTEPPVLPGRLLVALAAEFGVAPGTTRVALSRMVDRGELINDDGRYRLAGQLLRRQERQRRGQRADPAGPWDGTWEMALVTSSGRPGPERAALRRSLAALGLAERREGTWMRPRNLAPERLAELRVEVDPHVEFWTATPDGDAAKIAAELWDLTGWADDARRLIAAMDDTDAMGTGDVTDVSLPDGFVLSAAVLRHFVHDPQLPNELWPDGWPAQALRDRYRNFDSAYRKRLRGFFASVRRD